MRRPLAQLLPAFALAAAFVSVAAIAVVLFRVFGPLSPALPTHWTVRTEHDERVIEAGHDAEILKLIVHGADDVLPADERLAVAGIQVEGGTILVAFVAYPEERLGIRSATETSAAFVRTTAFAASWSRSDVPEAVRRYVAAIAAAPGWSRLWTMPAQGGPSHSQTAANALPSQTDASTVAPRRAEHPLLKASGSPEARVGEQSVWLIILWVLISGTIVATLLLLLGGRGMPPASGPRSVTGDAQPHFAAGATAMMAAGVALLAIAQFHFRIDDYAFLALATHYPTELTGETRILSTRAHYQLGVLLGGGTWWFAAGNLVALTTMCTGWGMLLRRIGWSFDAAVIAAAVLAMGPGTFFLLRQANGIEHLSATACLMLVLLLTDLAARERDRTARWRAGVLVLALCWSVLGVLMKLPLMIVLPPSCWLWGRWMVVRPAPPMNRSVTYLAFAAAVGGPMFALTRTAPGIGFLPSRWAFAAIGDRVSRYGLLVVVLLALGMRLAPAMRVLRSRVGRFPLLVWSLILSTLWIIPFVLHTEYEGEAHYGMLASAPWGAVAAAFIAAAIDQSPRTRWREIVAACLTCLILLPLGEIEAEMRRSAAEFVPEWLDQVHVLTAAQSPPQRIVVQPACPPLFAPTLRAQMNDIYSEIGVWWATGWYDVPVEFHDDVVAAEPGAVRTVTLGFCPGQRATVE